MPDTSCRPGPGGVPDPGQIPEPLEAAWGSVLDEVRRTVRALVSGADVDDLTSEVMVALLTSPSVGRGAVRDLTAYARVAARRACLATLRAAEVSPTFVADLEAFAPSATHTRELRLDLPSRSLQRSAIRRLLGELPDSRHRRVLVRHFLRGEPVKGVARRLRITPVQVRRCIRRILSRAKLVQPPPVAESSCAAPARSVPP